MNGFGVVAAVYGGMAWGLVWYVFISYLRRSR